MKKMFAVIGIVVISLSVGFADFSLNHRIDLFHEERMQLKAIPIRKDLRLEEKSEILAGGLGFFPGFGMGHSYSGDWDWSHPMLFTQGYGALFALTSTSHLGLSLAYGLILIGKVWEGMDAYNTAVDYNEQLSIARLEENMTGPKEVSHQLRTQKKELIKFKEANNYKKNRFSVAYGYGAAYGSTDGPGVKIGTIFGSNIETSIVGRCSSETPAGFGLRYYYENKEHSSQLGTGMYVDVTTFIFEKPSLISIGIGSVIDYFGILLNGEVLYKFADNKEYKGLAISFGVELAL